MRIKINNNYRICVYLYGRCSPSPAGSLFNIQRTRRGITSASGINGIINFSGRAFVTSGRTFDAPRSAPPPPRRLPMTAPRVPPPPELPLRIPSASRARRSCGLCKSRGAARENRPKIISPVCCRRAVVDGPAQNCFAQRTAHPSKPRDTGHRARTHRVFGPNDNARLFSVSVKQNKKIYSRTPFHEKIITLRAPRNCCVVKLRAVYVPTLTEPGHECPESVSLASGNTLLVTAGLERLCPKPVIGHTCFIYYYFCVRY